MRSLIPDTHNSLCAHDNDSTDNFCWKTASHEKQEKSITIHNWVMRDRKHFFSRAPRLVFVPCTSTLFLMDCNVINKHFKFHLNFPAPFMFHLSSERLSFGLTFREKPKRESKAVHKAETSHDLCSTSGKYKKLL